MSRLIRRTFLLIALLVATTAGLALADPDSPTVEPPPVRPFDKNITDIPFLDLDTPNETGQAAEAVSVLPWSKVVYQSLRDGNWEIYSGNDNGTNQTRLTNHLALDAYPRLNRGGTRIVFTSTRTGFYHIFVMNADGTGLGQLTSGETNNINPAWSPDGNWIVFESTRDGQNEIYIMSANGSLQTRLTNSSDYDGQPAWSPDGSKIAFVSRRTGGYRIYVMNGDGSNQSQRSQQPYSFRPTWSPNGLWIGYDADGNGDGWQDLWVMNVDGSGQGMLYDPPVSQTDAWAGSWSPDSRYLAFTHISFVFFQGNWYWVTAYTDARLGENGSIIRLSPDDTNWSPDWQTIDLALPQSKVNSLPAYSRANNFWLSWSGTDSGLAGIAGYDIQYRVGQAGSWTNWLVATNLTSAEFPAVPGETVYFRSRARDHAGNIESWPAVSDASTTFYTWLLGGVISDNRGVPLGNVPLTISPTPLNSAVTNESGRYFTRLLANGNHTVTPNRPGYGTVPNTTLNVIADTNQDFYLPPANNVIQNGTFEASSQQLTNWTVGGTIPALITTTTRASGQRAATAGLSCPYPCVSTGEVVTTASYSYPDIAIDSQGNQHLVYNAHSEGIFYRMRSPGGNWSPPYEVQNPAESTTNAFLVVDSQDTVHVVWGVLTPNQLFYKQRSAAGQWSPVLLVDTNKGVPIDLIADDFGRLHLLSANPSLYYRERSASGVWQPAMMLANNDSYSDHGAAIAAGPDGSVHVAWQQQDPPPCCTYTLRYRSRRPDGGWLAAESLYPNESHFGTEVFDLIAGLNGTLHLFWESSIGHHHSIWHPDAGWTERLPVTYATGEAATDEAGKIHFFTTREGGLYYEPYTPGSGPLGAILIRSGNPESLAAVAVDGNGQIHAVWNSGGSILYHSSRPAAISSDAIIAQTVTIPFSMYQPTLAFRYRFLGSQPGDDSHAQVTVSNGISQTAITLDGTGEEWRHQWLTLNAWSGQSVTVTFMLHQEENEAYVRLYIDDVSLGSTYPDLVVTSAGGTSAFPGETIVYQLNYRNRGAVAAANSLITATLPAGLTFVSASLPPITTSPSLVWDVGDLPAGSGPFTIEVAATVSAAASPFTSLTTTIIIDAESPELETANNTIQLVTFIGRRLYLPVIVR